MDLLKQHQFDAALQLLSVMKETWPTDSVFTVAVVMDNDSDDSSMSPDEDTAARVANLLGCLRHIFLGKPLTIVMLSCCSQGLLLASESYF